MMESSPKNRSWLRDILAILALSLILSALVTSFSMHGAWLPGFAGGSILFFIGLLIILLAYRKTGGIQFVGWMILLSIILRLGVGIALLRLLPVAGFDTDQQKGGYVFFDAYRREAQAVDLARSDQPVWNALGGKYATDQYGGYLMLTASIHRYLSPDDYRPQLILILSALMCTLGLPFVWIAAKRIWNERVARIAVWIYVLFPESIVLSASQMREPILIGCTAMALGAFSEWKAVGAKSNWAWLAVGLFGLLTISPGIILPVLIFIAGWWYLDSGKKKISWKIIAAAAAVLVVGVLLLANALGRQGHIGGSTPIAVIYNWYKSASQWDSYLLQQGSGRIQDIFKQLPETFRLPFVLVYGILQPVLPATIFDPSLPLWTILTTLLSAGWYILLPVLIYGVLAGFQISESRERKLMLWMGLIIWIWICVSAVRAGGDQWDNPRYRTILIPFIALFAARAWNWGMANKDRWLGRIFILEGIFLAIFSEWYISRTFGNLPRLPFLTMIAAIAGIWGFIIAVWVVWDKWKQQKQT